MSLRRRLRALEEASGRSVPVRPPSPPRGFEPEPPAADPLRQTLLEGLRVRMAEILARPAPARTQAPPSGERVPLSELPFASIEREEGVLWQRIETLPRGHRVGTIDVDLVQLACPRALSRLALDETLADVSPTGALFLDIETTGLGGAGSLPFLVGMASFDGSGRLCLEQLLLERPSSERALLGRVKERFERAELIVSFNGKAFDEPLLSSRYVMNGLPRLPQRPHLDLLHVARRLHRQRLERCSLKRIESGVLGFVRGEDIDGAEVAARYVRYLQTGDAAGLMAVVTHNHWDVVSMAALMGLYGQAVPALDVLDLASLARTLQRAGARNHALEVADLAYRRGGGLEALRVRARLAKAAGDVAGALRDFEEICEQCDDPASRLELAKLYEHRARELERALYWVDRGTGETADRHGRRSERLRRKLAALAPQGGPSGVSREGAALAPARARGAAAAGGAAAGSAAASSAARPASRRRSSVRLA